MDLWWILELTLYYWIVGAEEIEKVPTQGETPKQNTLGKTLRFPTLDAFGRDSEIAPTEEM